MFKDMLLATLSYPQPTSPNAISRAVDFAARARSTISCVAFEISLSPSLGYLSEGILDVEGMIAAVQQKSALAANEILDGFRNEAERQCSTPIEVVHPEVCLRTEGGPPCRGSATSRKRSSPS